MFSHLQSINTDFPITVTVHTIQRSLSRFVEITIWVLMVNHAYQACSHVENSRKLLATVYGV